MKKLLTLLAMIAATSLFPSTTKAAWTPTIPPEYTSISWVGGHGVKTVIKVPENSGYIDYLTIIHLPEVQIRLLTSSTPKTLVGEATAPFPEEHAENWSFAKTTVEKFKTAHPQMTFLWNAPFFNVNMFMTELSLSLKSSDADGPYITSGRRPGFDMEQPRKMLIIDNSRGSAKIMDFDESIFINEGDQSFEGFAPLSTPSAKGEQAARVFLGVRENGTELVVFCSRSASLEEASAALRNAGVAVEHQMQADGGGSATCAYNLPGQYFVEPNRSLPHVMGVFPRLPKGSVTIDKLNVRSGAGTTHTALRQLPIGTEVTIYEEVNGWYRIHETKSEWISAQYIKKPVSFPYEVTITIDQLNVRNGAGTTFVATRKLKINSIVTVLEEKNGWLKISDTEWISGRYTKQK
jgi:uncharacterized protein YraI